MSTEKLNSAFTVEDIHDYLSGKMTAAEMNAIEKAALDDPLLAEAIEGYATIPEFTETDGFEKMNEHLIELRAKFVEPKVVPINKYKTIWRIAAAFLLLLGSVAVIKYLTNTSSNKLPQTIAKAEPVIINTLLSTDSSKTFNADVQQIPPSSTITSDKKNAGSTPSYKVTEDKTKQPRISSAAGSVVQADSLTTGNFTITNNAAAPVIITNKDAYEKETTVSSTWANTNQNTKAKKTAQNNNAKIIFSGRVVDKNNNPIPFASIKTEEGLISTTDNKGTFSLPITSSNPGKVTFSGNNFLQKTVTPTNSFNLIVLENNKLSNSQNNNSGTLQSNPAQISILYKIGAEPVEGWTKYILFLVSKLSYSIYDNGKPVAGATIVKFEIDPYGLPTDFSFEKQIDSDVNDAVEDLIVTGPEWRVTDKSALPRIIRLKIIF